MKRLKWALVGIIEAFPWSRKLFISQLGKLLFDWKFARTFFRKNAGLI